MIKKHSKKHESVLDEVIDVPVEAVKKEWRLLKYIWIKDEDHLLFASFIVVLVAAVVIGGVYVSSHQPHIVYKSSSGFSSTDVSKVLTSSNTAVAGAFTAKISNVTETTKKDPTFPLADTETLLLMDLTVTNTSASNQNFIPSTQLYVRDTQGNEYPFRPFVSMAGIIESGELVPGKSISGKITFAVPKRLSDPLLYLDLGWDNYVPVVFSPLK